MLHTKYHHWHDAIIGKIASDSNKKKIVINEFI